MITFKEFLNESFVNIFKAEDKEQYAELVWDMLQVAYTPIGGIKGSGFKDKQDLIKNIPFWKLVRKNDEIIAVMLYKDKQGRKVAASATDGTTAGKIAMQEIAKNDIKRSFGEKSKGSLGLLMKTIPFDVLKDYVLTPEQASKALKTELVPITNLDKKDWPDDASFTMQKYPMLLNYGYLRKIGDNMIFKVAIGTPNITIKI
jgi:hypothetical protein